MTPPREQVQAQLSDDEQVIFLEPPEFDVAILGLTQQFSAPRCVCYDRARVIDVLIEMGCDHDDAEDFFAFNIIGAYVGDTTPVFLERIESCPEP